MQAHLAVCWKEEQVHPRRAVCLGCGSIVVLARHAHCTIGGRRDGTVLVVFEARPLVAAATDPGRIFEPGMELLGVAHRDCVPLARRRLEAQEVVLPQDLPKLTVDSEVEDLPSLDLPPALNACPFCGESEVGEEHVWAKWISRELSHFGGFVTQSPYGPRKSSTISVKAPVCDRCNNRWLSVLEKDVRRVLLPMMLGAKTRTLPVDDQHLLATWAVKTAFMIDLSKGSPIIPAGFYRDLRLQRRPLDGHFVWTGAYRGTKAILAWHRGLMLGAREDRAPLGFATTFTVSRALFQVVGHFTSGVATWDDNRRFRVGLNSLWPGGGESIQWPREGLAFDDDALEEIEAGVVG